MSCPSSLLARSGVSLCQSYLSQHPVSVPVSVLFPALLRPLLLRSLRALFLQFLNTSLVGLQLASIRFGLCNPNALVLPLIIPILSWPANKQVMKTEGWDGIGNRRRELTILSLSLAIASFHSFFPSFCSRNCACLWCSISALRASGSSLPVRFRNA